MKLPKVCDSFLREILRYRLTPYTVDTFFQDRPKSKNQESSPTWSSCWLGIHSHENMKGRISEKVALKDWWSFGQVFFLHEK